jgi:hypothetical protein
MHELLLYASAIEEGPSQRGDEVMFKVTGNELLFAQLNRAPRLPDRMQMAGAHSSREVGTWMPQLCNK